MEPHDGPLDWQAEFVLARHFRDPEGTAILRRRVNSGELVRVISGVYLESQAFSRLGVRSRHLLLARANMVVRGRSLVLSHRSAAVLWNLPLLTPPPSKVSVLGYQSDGGRSDEHLRRHCVQTPHRAETIGGLRVTTLARTTVDVARCVSLDEAAMVADAALRGSGLALLRTIDLDALRAEIPRHGSRGVARARQVVDFADARSGSPGETLSRVSMWRAGLPAPVLQQRFVDRYGEMFADFWWPRYGLIGEFDGEGKYLREDLRDGKTAAEVVVAEKWREDRLRALGPRVTRWGWSLARNPAALRTQLRAAGIR